MKKLFLLTFALALLFMWAAAGADNAPTNMSVSETGVPTIAEDRADVEQEKGAVQQERPVDQLYKGVSPVLEAQLPEKPAYTGPKNIPDPNVILQGGEDCASATAIPAIPYFNTGTTVGYADDYDAICPSSSTSPDVVYSYTPEVDICVDISLCDESAYDTKLFVYENDCALPEIACNDDACTTPNYPNPYVSRITGLQLTAGNTYYIVVDGWSGDAGSYSINVTECAPDLRVCPDGSIFDHPGDGNWVSVSDDEWPRKIFEDVHITGQVCDIHFWGGRFTGAVECFEDPMPFLIEFWSDDGSGLPDVGAGPTCTYSLSLTAVPTGEMFGPYFEIMRWDAILDPCCDFAGGWVSIQGLSDETGCYFWWESTEPYDGGYAITWTPGGGFETWNNDLSVCLTGELTGELGACCDEGTGECTEFVTEADCQSPLRFGSYTMCANLDPPCQQASFDGCETFDNGLTSFVSYVAGDPPGWQFTAGDGNPAGSAFHNDDDVPVGSDDWLISYGAFTVPANGELSWDQKTNWCVVYYEYHAVKISTDYVDGNDPTTATWTTLYTGENCEDEDVWGGHVIDLSAYVGQAVHIAFHYTGDWATEWWVDNVCISEPCVVECPVGATPEGEVDCYDEYVDDFNAGCNEDPFSISTVSCGETICGTSGYYVFEGEGRRDTDWYELVLEEPQEVTVTGMADFPLQLLIIELGSPGYECDSLSIPYFAQVGECDIATIVASLDAGTWWVWAGVYGGNPADGCGGVYWFTVECGELPLGACCDIDFGCIGDYNVFECAQNGGVGWYEGETCADFDCPFPTMVGLAETGNMVACGVSNYGPVGEFDLQGGTYDYNGIGAANYAGTFALGNSPTTMMLKYGTGVDNNPFRPTSLLDLADTFNPTSSMDDSDLYGGGGLDVDFVGYGFTAAEEENIFIVEYTVTNNTGADVNGLYAAIYLDWDLPESGADDTLEFDTATNLAIQYPRPPLAGSYYGLSLLSDTYNTLMGVAQEIFSYPNSGWHAESLYTYMSYGGVIYFDAVVYGDQGAMVSVGPFDLTSVGAETSKTMAWAIIGGSSAAEVISRVGLAGELWPPSEGDCVYEPGDSDEDGTARQLTDVVKMIAYYRGNDTPGYVCFCTEANPEYKPSADPDGNCSPFELTDVVHSIATYRGPVPLNGCPDCPGSRLGAPGEGTLIVPSLKSKAKINQRSAD